MKKIVWSRSRGRDAFTLVEMMASIVVLLLIMAIVLSVTTQTGALFRTTTAKIEEFRSARDAFEAMTRRLGQATLNTYWDYDNPTAPTRYIRQSELRFISGNTVALAGTPAAPRQWPTHGVFFQAPLGFSQDATTYGLENLLNTWGYFVEFGDDSAQRPSIVTTQIAPLHYRYRLCELMQPTNSLSIYSYTSGITGGVANNLSYTGRDWFSIAMNLPDTATNPPRPVHVLAENVIALVILPRLSQTKDPTGTLLAPQYTYDSTATNSNPDINPKNQLPPLLQVTMVAIGEASAARLAQGQGSTMPDLGLGSLFANASQMESDLNTLQQTLTNRHITFRVFSTDVAIKGAQWSRDEVK